MAASQREAKFDSIGQAFTQHYFTCFQSPEGRAQLRSLYGGDSVMTWMGEKFMGTDAVMNKLLSLSFRKLAYDSVVTEFQPGPAMSILILVSGEMKIDDEVNSMRFVQTFVIAPSSPGQYYIMNEIFSFN